MRRRLLTAGAVCQLVLLAAFAGAAATITLSGNVSYDGVYETASTLYVFIYDSDDDVAVGTDSVAVGTPPFAVAYSFDFDNSLITGPAILGAVLDVDDSGYDPVNLSTSPDIVGWYAGAADPTFIDTGFSQTGLDFPLPTGEIRGNVIFAPGQTWATIMACSVPNMWCPQEFDLISSGSYAIVGLYAGDFIVGGDGSLGDICYGDPNCISPTVVSLAAGEVRTGIDLDFSVLAITAESWGRIKAKYGR